MDEIIRVLIIDDDPEDANLAAIALRKAHSTKFAHKHASCLPDAFKLLESQEFDIVLLDLGLPGMHGIETLVAFRLRNSHLPVIVLSGLEDEAVAIQALDKQAQDYLYKNEVNARTLSRAIRYAIQRQVSVFENRRLLSRVRENELILQRKNDRLKSLYDTAHAFVDNVSHEFRTPLTVIKEYVSLVRDGTMGEINGEQARFLRIAEDRADDLNTMVDDMLDVSKLEAGMLYVRRNSYSVSELINRVLPSLTRKAAVRGLTLEDAIPGGLPTVFCDSEKVERVIINLAVNAMKFTKPGGTVRFWARETESDVVIGVTDDGPGIAEDCLKLIFERFKQVDIDVRSSTKGFGLGLNIARELVSLNLGEMQVESELNVGSTFSFSLPRHDPIEITHRFLATASRAGRNFMSLVVATVNPETASNPADDVDVFMSHLIRGHDLSFRVSRTCWILLLPEPDSEARQFVERAIADFETLNRNRPKGALPQVTFRTDTTWADLSLAREEVVGRVESHLAEFEALHA